MGWEGEVELRRFHRIRCGWIDWNDRRQVLELPWTRRSAPPTIQTLLLLVIAVSSAGFAMSRLLECETDDLCGLPALDAAVR